MVCTSPGSVSSIWTTFPTKQNITLSYYVPQLFLRPTEECLTQASSLAYQLHPPGSSTFYSIFRLVSSCGKSSQYPLLRIPMVHSYNWLRSWYGSAMLEIHKDQYLCLSCCSIHSNPVIWQFLLPGSTSISLRENILHLKVPRPIRVSTGPVPCTAIFHMMWWILLKSLPHYPHQHPPGIVIIDLLGMWRLCSWPRGEGRG